MESLRNLTKKQMRFQDRIFQQDNTPIHKIKNCQQFRERKEKRTANSLDLNSIKYV